jgi:septum formation protein
MYKLVLASQSPRRKELLTRAGFHFTALPVNISETPDKNLNQDQQILKIAAEKAQACLDQFNYLKSHDYLVLSADTLVVVDELSLGKPSTEEQAATYLRLLSNRSHFVKTAIHIINCKSFEQIQEITTTEVFFRNISDEMIKNYLTTGEPMDKAGAYAIQGLGGSFVDHYVGPYDNVVGLSIDSLNSMLKKKGWEVE